MENTIEIAGRVYLIERMDARAAFEAECLIFGALGPTLSISLASIAEPLIDALAEHVRTHLHTPGPDEGQDAPDFDLARAATLLDTLDTAGVEVRSVVESTLDQAGVAIARALDTAAPTLIDSLAFDRVRRLVELALLGCVFVVANGEPRKVVDWKALDAATGRQWSTKWRLLLAALVQHFRRGEPTEGER